MITKSNFKNLLLSLGFVNNGERYEKKFLHFGASMSVDFLKKKIYYPDAIKGRERNDGFDAPENFVVFECVTVFLKKDTDRSISSWRKNGILDMMQKADVPIYA